MIKKIQWYIPQLTKKSLLVFVILATFLFVGHARMGRLRVNGQSNLFGDVFVGLDGTGRDLTLYTDVAGEEFLWDASANVLELDGTNGSNVLSLTDGNLSVTDDVDVDGVTNLDVTDIDGAVDMASTLLVTGVTTSTGGVVFATMTSNIWSVGGAVALATAGTDVAPTDGPRQWVELQIPYNVALTGMGYLVGSVGGTDSVVVELFDSAGTLVARSIATDTGVAVLVATLAEFQQVAFSSTYNAVAGTYYMAISMNGTTARFRAYPIPNSGFVANVAAGTFKTAASITPTTTFVVAEGPISFVY